MTFFQLQNPVPAFCIFFIYFLLLTLCTGPAHTLLLRFLSSYPRSRCICVVITSRWDNSGRHFHKATKTQSSDIHTEKNGYDVMHAYWSCQKRQLHAGCFLGMGQVSVFILCIVTCSLFVFASCGMYRLVCSLNITLAPQMDVSRKHFWAQPDFVFEKKKKKQKAGEM